VAAIDFVSPASGYSIDVFPSATLIVSGNGVANSSSRMQNFAELVDVDGYAGQIIFRNAAGAGASTNYSIGAGVLAGAGGAILEFLDTSSAQNASFFLEGGRDADSNGGSVVFADSSTAANAVFVSDGATGENANGGSIFFGSNASAGTASFLINGSSGSTYVGGSVYFGEASTAGSASFTINGTPGQEGAGGDMTFQDTSTAAQSAITVNGAAASGAYPGSVSFFADSSAGDAQVTCTGGLASQSDGGNVIFYGNSTAATSNIEVDSGEVGRGGYVVFSDDSTAASSTIRLPGSTIFPSLAGQLSFYQNSTAERSAITLEGDTISEPPLSGPLLIFGDEASAGEAVVTCEGGRVEGASGGQLLFDANATAANATLTMQDGSAVGGEGGKLFFYGQATGGAARLELFGNGNLDLSIHDPTGMTIGSIEGDGGIFLGAVELAAGTNDLCTTFSGVIQDGGVDGGKHGSLRKVGNGTLTLSGASLYTGGTTVESGTLLLCARRGSATGQGPLQVNGGTLAGSGKVRGGITIGNGSAGGKLAPGRNGVGALAIQRSLSFAADGELECEIDLKRAIADAVSANGAFLDGNISLVPLHAGDLSLGTVLPTIVNTSSQPINGSFTNLPDGSVIIIGGNKLQASYEGGDGNDLTLTVIP
jgi:autotransporter-associated beta strand protein